MMNFYICFNSVYLCYIERCYLMGIIYDKVMVG